FGNVDATRLIGGAAAGSEDIPLRTSGNGHPHGVFRHGLFFLCNQRPAQRGYNDGDNGGFHKKDSSLIVRLLNHTNPAQHVPSTSLASAQSALISRVSRVGFGAPPWCLELGRVCDRDTRPPWTFRFGRRILRAPHGRTSEPKGVPPCLSKTIYQNLPFQLRG